MILSIIFVVLIPILTLASPESELLKAIDLSVRQVKNRTQQPFAEACYEDIGCFSTTGPMKHTGILPDSPAYINTKFFAYSNSAPATAREVNPKDENTFTAVAQSGSLAIVIHGFGSDSKGENLIKLKDALIKYGNLATVILVDWQKGATSPWYDSASTNTQVVGRQTAYLVNELKKSRNINPQNVHLFGYSLGAHVSGFAGKFSQSEYNWKFGRISALDAASPLFESYPGSHLITEDATFVDAIHTSAGTNILTGQLGFTKPVGHVDFYPNGGAKQPHCGILSLTCNHGSSVTYMETSLTAQTSCPLKAFKCLDWNEFNSGKCADTKGESSLGFPSASHPGRGNHYLKTQKNYPYCCVYLLFRNNMRCV